MVECQVCNHWYNYNCILRRRKRLCGSFFDDSQIRCICGYNKCKFKNSIVVANGKYIPLKPRNIILFDEDSTAFVAMYNFKG